MSNKRRSKPKSKRTKKSAADRARRAPRSKGRTVMVTMPFPGLDGGQAGESCPCPICDVLRDELGETPEVVDLSRLSKEGRERLRKLGFAA